MKEMSLVFLKKSELQHRGDSMLITFFSIPSMWGSQKDMFQWKHLRNIFVFSDTGIVKTRIVKKLTEKLKKVSSIVYIYK